MNHLTPIFFIMFLMYYTIIIRTAISKPISIQSMPYVAALVKYTSEGHYCNGIYIKSGWILTAAHCLNQSILAETVIRMGSEHSRRGGQTTPIQHVVIHQKSTDKRRGVNAGSITKTVQTRHNIALIKVSPYKTGSTIKQIDIRTRRDNYTGNYVSTAGFGRICEKDPVSDRLNGLSFKIVKADRHVLYGDWNKTNGGCKGNSGGPVTLGSKLVGIIVCGYNCDKNNREGLSNVILRILPHIRWINKRIDSFEMYNNSKRCRLSSFFSLCVLSTWYCLVNIY